LWYEDASAAVDYAKHSSRSHDAVIRVYDEAGNVIETDEFKAWLVLPSKPRRLSGERGLRRLAVFQRKLRLMRQENRLQNGI
jgi:hypothetical protein